MSLPEATHVGEIVIGKTTISCAVLEDGSRVLVAGSMVKALDIKGGGQYWKRRKKGGNGGLLPEYVSARYLQEYISDELKKALGAPISYVNTNNRTTIGVDATILPDICEVWITALENGGLTTDSQKKTARMAQLIIRGLAKVGITALVDEATGYQYVRDRLALQKILEKYISQELMKWQKRFPDEFYKELFRLNQWQYNPLSVKRPAIVGKYTNDIVYDRLAPGVLKELKRVNPKDEKGRRRNRHHQWLTEDIGHPKLHEHLLQVIVLMRASPNYNMFKRLLRRSMPKPGETMEMNVE